MVFNPDLLQLYLVHNSQAYFIIIMKLFKTKIPPIFKINNFHPSATSAIDKKEYQMGVGHNPISL